MIKNQRQFSNTKTKLDELIKERAALANSLEGKELTARDRLALNGYDALILDLERQLGYYEKLKKGEYRSVKPHLNNIEEALIAARIAQNLSHADLAEKLGLKEQQVQRYEATDYAGVTYTRIAEIAKVLQINCHFKETWIINTENVAFDLPDGVSKQDRDSITEVVRKNSSLIID